MEKYYNECVQNLDYQINELSVEIEDRMRLAQEVIKLLIKCLADLKQEVMKSWNCNYCCMPKFGNNIETNITGSPQCGIFFQRFLY